MTYQEWILTSYLSRDKIFQAVKRQKIFNILKIKVTLKGGFVSIQNLRKNHTS